MKYINSEVFNGSNSKYMTLVPIIEKPRIYILHHIYVFSLKNLRAKFTPPPAPNRGAGGRDVHKAKLIHPILGNLQEHGEIMRNAWCSVHSSFYGYLYLKWYIHDIIALHY